jgi:two-component system chemotaxis response regulator CheB
MAKTKVLVIDDAVLVRKLLSDALNQDTELEVVATAATGSIGLQKIPRTQPDVIILDVEMPEMDGITTLKHIRTLYPKIPVIMFSSLTERGAATTLDALSLGAMDYVTKPGTTGGTTSSKEDALKELKNKIKALVPHQSQNKTPRIIRHQEILSCEGSQKNPVEIVAIGVSTGGPNALAEVLTAIPKSFNLPIVITQHMPPVFTKMLAERLAMKCLLPAHEGEDGMQVLSGHIYIAPGNYHMTLNRKGKDVFVSLNQDKPEHSCRPAVDVMFRSVVQTYGGGVLGVVLTGMGIDGLAGARCIRDAGGEVVVQDEATSVVWGMPGAIAEAGLANAVVPLHSMTKEILKRCTGQQIAGRERQLNSKEPSL